jgi:NAD(P)-dependent dehydrogenase (short-subunit alcohol dehydrogenase family)
MAGETGMTILVTGATDGIGTQTALELLRRGHHVVVHGRNAAKVDAVKADLTARVAGARVDGVVFDLASLAAVRAGAAEVLARHERLHVLLNNAGVFSHARQVTVDGFELSFGVNHLAHFLLTELLLPRLVDSAAAAGRASRVVNVSSQAHQGGRIVLTDLQLTRGYTGFAAYGASKLANVLHAKALAARLDAAQVTANSLHPGVIATKLLRQGWGASGASLEQGARTSVYVALDPALEGVSGRYFSDSREAQPSGAAQDAQLAADLEKASLRLVGLA